MNTINSQDHHEINLPEILRNPKIDFSPKKFKFYTRKEEEANQILKNKQNKILSRLYHGSVNYSNFKTPEKDLPYKNKNYLSVSSEYYDRNSLSSNLAKLNIYSSKKSK